MMAKSSQLYWPQSTGYYFWSAWPQIPCNWMYIHACHCIDELHRKVLHIDTQIPSNPLFSYSSSSGFSFSSGHHFCFLGFLQDLNPQYSYLHLPLVLAPLSHQVLKRTNLGPQNHLTSFFRWLFFFLHFFFITNWAISLRSFVWKETTAIFAKSRILFHLFWLLIHFLTPKCDF